MFFEAESNGIKYQMNVSETRASWLVGLKADGKEWVHYEIRKEDYQVLDGAISFLFKNSSYLVDVTENGTDYTVYTRGTHRGVKIYNEEKLLHESLKGKASFGTSGNLTAGMPGKISKVMVQVGDQVKAEQPLLIMEAMKMENEMRASSDRKVKAVHVKPGDNVETGALLISFEDAK